MSASRVLIDGYFLGKPSGYGRFIFELCRAIGNTNTGIEFIVAVQSSADEAFLPKYKNIKYEILNDSVFPLWEQLKIPICAARNRCNLIHFPYNTKSLLSLHRSVTTVHDLTFFSKTKRDWKSALIHYYMRTTFNISVRNSDAIIAVSETTRDALRMKSIAATRIYNTVDGFIGAQNSSGREKPARPYFLHRGSYAANHRNTDRVIEAFLSCPELTEKYDLKILGVPDGASHWTNTADRPVIFLDQVTDGELASIYAKSSCVLAVSLLEGFCLPIVEAFGFGVPVIASDVNPMMEIAGDAALLVSPYDVEELGRAMLRVMSDADLAQSLVQKGRLRLAEFASENMAHELLKIYGELLNRDT